MKSKRIENKGITLIALIITIIVLLILAGITINLTIGEKGIITRAQEAGQKHILAQVKEELDLAIFDIKAEDLSEGKQTTIDTIVEKLPTKLDGVTIEKKSDTIAEGTYKGHEFIVTEELEVVIKGTTDQIEVTSINFPTTTVTIKIGENITLSPQLEPINATNQNLKWTSSNENIVKVNENGIVSAIGTGETTITATSKNGTVSANCTVKVEAPKLADVVSVGDYVDYDPGDYSYTSEIGTASKNGNGYAQQTYVTKNDGKMYPVNWRVFSINKETGVVELISEDPIYPGRGNLNYNFKGGIGYLYYEQEIANACAIFGHGNGANTTLNTSYTIGGPKDSITGTISNTGARSITIEDINKLVGATEDTFKTSNEYYNTAIIELWNTHYPSRTGDSATGQSTTAAKLGLNNTAYAYQSKNLIDTTSKTFEVLFTGSGNKNLYWVQSRSIGKKGDDANRSYNMRAATYDGWISDKELATGFDTSLSLHDTYSMIHSTGIRPIITLNSNVTTSGKDENKTWKMITE